MKDFTATQDFDYPWAYVTAANWRKYPNKVSTHVVAVDVLHRQLDPDTQILRTERLITCKQPIPDWLKMFVHGAEISYVREVSIVDRLNKTLTMRSVNLSLAKLLRVYETVVYTPNPTDPLHKTVFTQYAQFTSQTGWSSVQNKIESWGVDRFSSNASKGKLGFESILELGLLSNVSHIIEQINSRTSNLIKDINIKSDQLIDEITDNSSMLLEDIKNCIVFKDINNISLDTLKDLNIKSEIMLNEISMKIFDEMNEMSKTSIQNSENLLNLINQKKDELSNEFNIKKDLITNQIMAETKNIFNELNSKTNELLNNDNVVDNTNTSPTSLHSKFNSIVFRIFHPFSK